MDDSTYQYRPIASQPTFQKAIYSNKLRKTMTEPERIMWSMLRANRFHGWHFRRQAVIHGFIVDFYCHKPKVAIELDGETHYFGRQYDRERDRIISSCEILILRFRNYEVFNSLTEVLTTIEAHIRVRLD